MTSCCVYKDIRDLESIDHLCINFYPQDGINTQVIYRFALAQAGCTCYFLLNNSKQSITSLSLLVGMTVRETAL